MKIKTSEVSINVEEDVVLFEFDSPEAKSAILSAIKDSDRFIFNGPKCHPEKVERFKNKCGFKCNNKNEVGGGFQIMDESSEKPNSRARKFLDGLENSDSVDE